MKLIEKRCPNCGAGLSFNENDKNVQCEYCKMNYEIKKDEEKQGTLSADEINLVEVQKVGKYVMLYFILSSIIPFILFCVIFGIALFVILKVVFQMM